MTETSMLSDLNLLICLVGGYLLGAVPFGLVLTRMAGLGDIRQIGSGNIGATNVLRTGHKFLALLTLLLDSGKGAIAVGIGYMLEPVHGPAIGGTAAFLGHVFPIWLKFKGGKGVATFLGTLFALNLMIGVIAGLSWLVSAVLFKISSLSALIATLVILVVSYFDLLNIADPSLFPAILAMGALIFWAHRSNIVRILEGVEPKIGGKKKD